MGTLLGAVDLKDLLAREAALANELFDGHAGGALLQRLEGVEERRDERRVPLVCAKGGGGTARVSHHPVDRQWADVTPPAHRVGPWRQVEAGGGRWRQMEAVGGDRWRRQVEAHSMLKTRTKRVMNAHA